MGHSIIRQNFMKADGGNGSGIFGEGEIMSWITIYISGKGDFREDVRKKLLHSDQRYLQGYIESPGEETAHDLFWLDDRTSLREFKEAISAKLLEIPHAIFYNPGGFYLFTGE